MVDGVGVNVGYVHHGADGLRVPLLLRLRVLGQPHQGAVTRGNRRLVHHAHLVLLPVVQLAEGPVVLLPVVLLAVVLLAVVLLAVVLLAVVLLAVVLLAVVLLAEGSVIEAHRRLQTNKISLISPAGFLSQYLSGPLPPVRRHITVDKMC